MLYVFYLQCCEDLQLYTDTYFYILIIYLYIDYRIIKKFTFFIVYR